MPTFSHLHSHTQYSLLDGQASIGALMKKAQADGMPAVALTDHGNMFGAFNFVAEANKYNVKPIVGSEFYMVADRHKKTFLREKGEKDNRYHQLLLAKDQAGYHNLSKLSSLSYIEGVYSKFPRIDKELILKYHEGLIATSCCIGAEIPQAILFESEARAEELLKWWLGVFGDDYYIEIQRHGLENFDGTGKSQEHVNQVLLGLAHKHNVKVICTNDSHYVDQTDYAAHDLLLCVNTAEERSIPVGDFETNYYTILTGAPGTAGQRVHYNTLDQLRTDHSHDENARRMLSRIDEELQKPPKQRKRRFGFANDQFYFKTQAQMNELFLDVPESVDNTNEIVDKITPPKLARDILLPNFPLPAEFANADDFLRDLTFKGAFGGERPRYSERTAEVEERLNYELRIIQTMGFAGYFLITQDFINKGRSMGVAVGPGRGSAAGSAVAYCVGITNIDPIKYSLLFERFLNPERVSMPDIDIDFDDVNRQKVIDYVVQKYGKTQVAQIITFGTMAAKSSIKDVARAMELGLPAANEMAKLVPEKPGTTLDGALRDVPELRAILDDTQDLKGQILALARRLEGSVRNTGIHAAGVIIAPDDITKYIPVSTSKDSDLLVTQFDGKVIESAGMLKMDFLGLKTLTIIVDALNLIERNHGIKIDIDNIPLDDPKTYALYQRGDTIGTFQFESEGMRMYLKDLKPTNIEDLIAMNALYRPGPMQFIPDFINRKHGREPVEYPHELLEPILKHSQGICVTGDTLVHDADTGARVRLDELASRVGSFRVQGVDEELRPAVATATHFYDNGLRDVVRVRLRDGSTVTMTPDHKVLTESGWLEIGQLAPGDFIGTPRHLAVTHEADYDLGRLRTLAYLLADGSLTSGASCDFVSQSPALVAAYSTAVSSSFGNLTLSTLQQVREVTRVSVKVTDKAYYHEPTTLLTWLRGLGLKTQKGGLGSREKFVPEFVFGLNSTCIAHFLAALWDCDGHIGEKICFYKTISPLLARDVHTLLLRLGLRPVVYETRYRNVDDAEETTAFQVSTYQLRDFDALVGPHLVEKRRQYGERTTPATSDTVDRELFVAELRQAWIGSDKELMRTHGFDRQHLMPARRARNPRISAALVAPLTQALVLPATTLGVRWEEIVSIEPAGQQRVYDITVEGIHNFIGNNLYLHNCVYQEQIMQAAQIMAGYTLGGADLLRRAMGKKDMKKMALEREKFVKGAADLHKIPAKKASEVFDVMEKFAEYGFNRCLTGDAVVFDARTGRRWTMAEIHAQRPTDLAVHALDAAGKLHVRPVTDVFDNGVKPIFEVVTRQGKRLRATANHPLRTPAGWVLLENLSPGDRIAAPRQLRTAATATWPAHELIALAGLISEGNTCHPSCLYFFGNHLPFVEDFAAAIGQFPDTVGRINQRRDAVRYEVCASTGRQSHAGSGPRRSGAYQWAQNLGLTGKKATEKFVPVPIFELSDDNISLFVGRLWAGDGFIANHKEHTPWYATSSAQLARDVQALLLRLGMQSGIHTKQFKYRGGLRQGYTVRLIGENSTELFLELLAPHCLGREAAVEQLRAYLAATVRGLTSKDTVPHHFARTLVAAERETSGLTWQQVETQSGVSMKEFIGKGSHVKQAFRRSTLGLLANFFASPTLSAVANSDIFWDEIVSITPAGEEPTYDLTVAEHHNFVANGLVVHNSHSAAYSVVAYQTGYLKANYPAEYMAAVLTNNMGDIKKVTFFIEEARKQGVAVLGPDVNESEQKFNVPRENQIRFGLAAVKGAGEAAVLELVEERQKHGPFTDVFDFAKRVNLRSVNKKTWESLAQAGAFDSFEKYNRRQFMDAPAGDQNLIEKAMKLGQQHQAAKESAQHSLFGASAFGAVSAPLPKVQDLEEWSAPEKLRREKEVVGFYLSGHPLDTYRMEIDAYCTCPLDKLDNQKGKDVSIAGLVSGVLFRTTKSGQPMVSFNIEDYDSSLNLALFRDDYSKFGPLINPKNHHNEQVPPMFIRGKMELRYGTQDQWELKIKHMEQLSTVADKLSKGVRVKLDLRTVTGPMIDRLQEAIEHAKGSKRLEIQFVEPHEKLAVDMFSRRFQIEPKAFIEKMREFELDVCALI